MKVIVVGAGAVGAVVGALLEAAGHELTFWVRPDQRAQLTPLVLERVSGRGERVESAAPRCVSAGDPLPECDWVLVCVRGEQLDAALADVVRYMGAAPRVAIATISLSDLRESARVAGLRGELYALQIGFGSYLHGARPRSYRWFPFAAPTLVMPEAAGAKLSGARGLARALTRAGLSAHAALGVTGPMRLMATAISVLLLSWDLCGWEITQLARDRALRRETAAAMREAALLVLPPRSPLRLLPRLSFALVVRALPLVVRQRGRALWHSHGPKIRAQTEHAVRELLARAERAQKSAPVLARLFARFREQNVEARASAREQDNALSASRSP